MQLAMQYGKQTQQYNLQKKQKQIKYLWTAI